MSRVRQLRHALDTLRGIALLGFTNLFLAATLWTLTPLRGPWILVSGLFWMLAVPSATYLLFLIAWKAEAVRTEPRSRLSVLEDIVYSLLMLEGGVFLLLIFGAALGRALHLQSPSEDPMLAFDAIMVGVGVLLTLGGSALYRQRVSALQESRITLPHD